MTSISMKNIVSSPMDAAIVGGIGVCISDSEQVVFGISRDVFGFRLF